MVIINCFVSLLPALSALTGLGSSGDIDEPCSAGSSFLPSSVAMGPCDELEGVTSSLWPVVANNAVASPSSVAPYAAAHDDICSGLHM